MRIALADPESRAAAAVPAAAVAAAAAAVAAPRAESEPVSHPENCRCTECDWEVAL